MSQPLVSLITPAHNVEAYLRECLDSVLQQSLEDLEIVCVDDASSDRTRAILQEYRERDPRVVLHLSDENIGQGAARNLAMKAATGKYLLHLDSDDYLAPDALETLTTIAEADAADIVYGRMQLFDKKTLQRMKWRNDSSFVFTHVRRTCMRDYPCLVYAHNTLNRVFRRQFLVDRDIWFETSPRWGEDVLFTMKSNFYAETISVVFHPTYHYRAGNYLGAAIPQKVLDARDNMTRALRFVEKNGEPLLIREMQKKQAKEAANLKRAAQVYEGEALLAYLPSLLPMVERTSRQVLAELPPYERNFCSLLKAREFEGALGLWRSTQSNGDGAFRPGWVENGLIQAVAPTLPNWVKDPMKKAIGMI